MRPAGPATTRVADGLAALLDAVLRERAVPALAGAVPATGGTARGRAPHPYLSMAVDAVREPETSPGSAGGRPSGHDTAGLRITALVDLAREGDGEAFGQLYDHYVESIHRYLYYRVSDVSLAEDLTSETFFRALRAVRSFQWQGKDFGAWLTTIARNLVTDHFKSSRSRLELVSDTLPESRAEEPDPETGVLAALSSEMLVGALRQLSNEQQDCLVMRFLQGLSIADTAQVLGRSEGAVKQLQLRAIRNLARILPEDVR
jgi:RNA polymerase sigma-70 factor (ECF subfamily)